MNYLLLFLVFAGFVGSASAQYIGDSRESGLVWPPVCIGVSCPPPDQVTKNVFSSAISKPFDQSDYVIVGTIIQKENQGNQITYSINVDLYLKNKQSFDMVTATLNNATEPPTFPDVFYYNSPVFNKGDLVFVYLKKVDGSYTVLPQSFALDKHEVRGPPPDILLTTSPRNDKFTQGDVITISGQVRKAEMYYAAKKDESLGIKLTILDEQRKPVSSKMMSIDTDGNFQYDLQTFSLPPGQYDLDVNYGPETMSPRITLETNLKYWTPLKQFKSGITIEETQCREGLSLVIKSPENFPACVKPDTKYKLNERGWTIYSDDYLDLPICDPNPKQNFGKCRDTISTHDESKFKIIGLDKYYHPNEPLSISIEKTGYDMCDGWSAKIIDYSDNSTVWNRDYSTSCVTLDPPKIQKFVYEVTNQNHPIMLSKAGDYSFQIDIGGVHLEQDIVIRQNMSGVSLDRTVYPVTAFTNGTTEIINPEHGFLDYTTTKPVLEETFLSKSIQQWNDAQRSELESEYEKYDGDFYTDLGSLLIKNEMQNWMNKLGIINTDNDFIVIGGSALTSLPPYLGFSTIINATDNHYYLLAGSTYANQVSFYKATQLQYPKQLARENILPSETSTRTTVTMKGENDLQSNPSSIVLSSPKSVEFSNETPATMAISIRKDGAPESSNEVSSIVLESNSVSSVALPETGSYSWRAKTTFTTDDKKYELNTGGTILILSKDMSNLSQQEQMETTKTMIIESSLPIVGIGQHGQNDTLYITFDPAINELLPESKSYYLQTAQSIIPFDITLEYDR